MMIIDLLITVLVIFVLVVGVDGASFWVFALAVWITIGLIILTHFLVNRMSEGLWRRLLGQAIFKLPSGGG
jgi:hypothetical protein